MNGGITQLLNPWKRLTSTRAPVSMVPAQLLWMEHTALERVQTFIKR